MFMGIIVGVALGYFFKPQIEEGSKKLIKIIKANLNKGKTYNSED